jgi:Uma2 family endonuclease
MTVEEFEQLPDPPGGEDLELVRGVIVMAPPADTGHGERGTEIGALLREFVRKHRLGRITGEGGYFLAEDPDVVRAPDTAWRSKDRVERVSPRKTRYFKGAPNLAVEVVSPTDRDSIVADKVQDWLHYGCDRVWVVRAQQRTVTVFHPDGAARVYSDAHTLDSRDAGFPIDGFALPVSAIFDIPD